ncbi:MAG: cytochrome b/b6 domain-containing protein [Sulfuricaulis sp.]|jgi:thiosulfate reductase cytochrome b subunit
MTERVYIFKRFERFWHWTQAATILFLLLTGFEVHGAYKLFGFGRAVDLHTIAAWTLITLWVFAVFWHFTTGEWRQYIPTLDKVGAMIKYYLTGIFTDAPHPFRATTLTKHNPLQRLAYLFLWLVITPIIWFSGWFYLFYGQWREWGVDGFLSLEWVAFFHVLGAYMILVFVIAHTYLITAGHTATSHLKAMITGWEETH